MPLVSSKQTSSSLRQQRSGLDAFMESQRLAKQRVYEKQAKTKRIGLEGLTVFTQQLSSMLDAGLPLVGALEALQDQVEDPVFKIIVRDVRLDVTGGMEFSEACGKFPNAFPNLFVSMAQAGEASGNLAGMLEKVSEYFMATVKLMKKVKSAMTYPITVITIAIALVNVLLIFVIPVFGEMFQDFGSELPKPTQMLLDLSDFTKAYWWAILGGGYAIIWLIMKLCKTPQGRRRKDQLIFRLPVVGPLSQKVSISRFSRTYAILLKSGVPILHALEICSRASGNTYIEGACEDISKHISQGGQFSEVVETNPYFPAMVKHMSKAGEQTGNVDGMLEKISDFYDDEIDNIISSLTSLMEPILITVLGVVIGAIVMAMFMPIFQLSSVVG